MKEELLQLFPTPLLIVPYEQPLDKELAYLKTISYRKQEQNGNFRSDDSYLLRNEEFKIPFVYFCTDSPKKFLMFLNSSLRNKYESSDL